MSQILACAATAISLLALVRADCTIFTPSTGYSLHFSDFVPASTVDHCYNGALTNTNGAVPQPTGFTCSGSANHPGCGIVTSGDLTIYGRTNLSISTSAAASLFPLLPQYNDTTVTPSINAVPAQSYCIDSTTNQAVGCIDSGAIGYLMFAQSLACMNGTFSGCSGGPVANGTAAQMCGVVDYTFMLAVRNASSLSFDNGYTSSVNQCTPSAGSAVRAATGVAALVAGVVVLFVSAMC